MVVWRSRRRRGSCSAQAVFCRRRYQTRRAPHAKVRPGRPAPAMGPERRQKVPGWSAKDTERAQFGKLRAGNWVPAAKHGAGQKQSCADYPHRINVPQDERCGVISYRRLATSSPLPERSSGRLWGSPRAYNLVRRAPRRIRRPSPEEGHTDDAAASSHRVTCQGRLECRSSAPPMSARAATEPPVQPIPPGSPIPALPSLVSPLGGDRRNCRRMGTS